MTASTIQRGRRMLKLLREKGRTFPNRREFTRHCQSDTRPEKMNREVNHASQVRFGSADFVDCILRGFTMYECRNSRDLISVPGREIKNQAKERLESENKQSKCRLWDL
jgi:hypothetical protein